MRLPKTEFCGEEKRFEVALAIAPIVLSELYKQSDDILVIKKLLPIEISELSKSIIEELKK